MDNVTESLPFAGARGELSLLEQRLDVHFPVNVLVRQHTGTDGLHQGLIDTIRALEMKYGATDKNAATNGASTTRGGFQTPPDMDFLELDNAHVRDFRNRVVLPAVEQYLQDVFSVNPYLTPFALKSWANVLRKGHWQAPHMHPTEFTIISGVYYIHVPELAEPSGCLEFINPHPQSISLGGQSATRRHRPRTGELLLFPPYYMHYVHPIEEDMERLVAAWDVRLKV